MFVVYYESEFIIRKKNMHNLCVDPLHIPIYTTQYSKECILNSYELWILMRQFYGPPTYVPQFHTEKCQFYGLQLL